MSGWGSGHEFQLVRRVREVAPEGLCTEVARKTKQTLDFLTTTAEDHPQAGRGQKPRQTELEDDEMMKALLVIFLLIPCMSGCATDGEEGQYGIRSTQR